MAFLASTVIAGEQFHGEPGSNAGKGTRTKNKKLNNKIKQTMWLKM